MGTYASQSDLEAVFGTTNVAKWSQLDPAQDNTTADTTRIAAAIAHAEADIDDRFRFSMYQVPLAGLAGVPKVLIHWVAVLAGMWLYRSRAWDSSAEQSVMYETMELRVDQEIAAYQAGQKGLNCTLKQAGGGAYTTAAPSIRM